jgi:hypothetical protein
MIVSNTAVALATAMGLRIRQAAAGAPHRLNTAAALPRRSAARPCARPPTHPQGQT